jgi:hypothetical protein
MSISVVDGVKAWARALHFPADPGAQSALFALKSYLAAQKGNPDLQCVEFDYLTGSDTIIADAACRIYAIILVKATATDAWFKGSDSATTSSSTAGEVTQKVSEVGEEIALIYPGGFAMASGFTVSCDTTAAGNTGSSAGDGAKGLVLLGRP